MQVFLLIGIFNSEFEATSIIRTEVTYEALTNRLLLATQCSTRRKLSRITIIQSTSNLDSSYSAEYRLNFCNRT